MSSFKECYSRLMLNLDWAQQSTASVSSLTEQAGVVEGFWGGEQWITSMEHGKAF